MSEIVMFKLCSVCLQPVRWYQDWVGTKRYNDHMWVERAHYKCWKKEQQNARAGATKMDVPRMDDVFALRDNEPRP